MARTAPARPTAFRHEALLYSGIEDFVDRVGAFVREGIEAGEPILVMVPAGKIASLQGAIPDRAAGRLLFRDIEAVGRNPACIIPAWRTFVDAHGGQERPVRGVGEPVWPGREPDELVESQRHESLLNLAFAEGCPFTLLCPFDRGALPPEVVEEASRTHPVLREDELRRRSESYPSAEVGTPFHGSLPPPRATPYVLRFGSNDLDRIRRATESRAEDFGLDRDRAMDLMLAVHEAAANSVRHGGGGGTLRIWAEGASIFAEVQDSGHIEDPLAGRRHPTFDENGGCGLWVTNHLCDLVQIRSGDHGTVVRMRMRR